LIKSECDFLAMKLLPRLLYFPVLHIDTNLINARQKLDAVNQLERWRDEDVVLINMSGTAYGEAKSGRDARRVRKANQQIFSMTRPAGASDPIFKKIEEVLFPSGTKNENQRSDVQIVCEAVKYAAILVTGDGASKSQPGGILGNRDKLQDLLRIVSPEEAVELVREKIRERDEFNKQVAREFGLELPTYTGADKLVPTVVSRKIV